MTDASKLCWRRCHAGRAPDTFERYFVHRGFGVADFFLRSNGKRLSANMPWGVYALARRARSCERRRFRHRAHGSVASFHP